jgi:hypothetical protein
LLLGFKLSVLIFHEQVTSQTGSQQAGERQGVPAKRISSKDALRWLVQARADEALLPSRVIPERPCRSEPRVQKRRPKPYDVMSRPRSVL